MTLSHRGTGQDVENRLKEVQVLLIMIFCMNLVLLVILVALVSNGFNRLDTQMTNIDDDIGMLIDQRQQP